MLLMEKQLILFWRKMKRIKILRPLNFLIFKMGISRWFNVFMDSLEVRFAPRSINETNVYFCQEKSIINENIKALYDNRSKKIYKNIINYRRTHNRKYIRKKGFYQKTCV